MQEDRQTQEKINVFIDKFVSLWKVPVLSIPYWVDAIRERDVEVLKTYQDDVRRIKSSPQKDIEMAFLQEVIDALEDNSPESVKFVETVALLMSLADAKYIDRDREHIALKNIFKVVNKGILENPKTSYFYLKQILKTATDVALYDKSFAQAVRMAISDHPLATPEDICICAFNRTQNIYETRRPNADDYQIELLGYQKAINLVRNRITTELSMVPPDTAKLEKLIKTDVSHITFYLSEAINRNKNDAKPFQEMLDMVKQEFDSQNLYGFNKEDNYIEHLTGGLESTILNQNQTIAELQQKVAALERANGTKQTNLDQLNDRIGTLESEKTDLETRLRTSESKYTKIKKAYDSLLKILDAKMGILKIYLAEVAKAKEKVFGRGRELAELGTGLEKDINMKEMEEEVKQIKTSLQQQLQGPVNNR